MVTQIKYCVKINNSVMYTALGKQVVQHQLQEHACRLYHCRKYIANAFQISQVS